MQDLGGTFELKIRNFMCLIHVFRMMMMMRFFGISHHTWSGESIKCPVPLNASNFLACSTSFSLSTSSSSAMLGRTRLRVLPDFGGKKLRFLRGKTQIFAGNNSALQRFSVQAQHADPI